MQSIIDTVAPICWDTLDLTLKPPSQFKGTVVRDISLMTFKEATANIKHLWSVKCDMQHFTLISKLHPTLYPMYDELQCWI